MKKTKRIASVVVIILVIVMVGCVLASCSVKNQIIGEWKSETTSTDNYYYVLKFYENGTYEKTLYSVFMGTMISTESGNYTIEENTISCHQGNYATVYKYEDGKITTGDYVYLKQK